MKEILKSWNENAKEWISVMESQQIPSRKYTNRAITQVLKELSVSTILDCGCGEGWLTRNMINIGKKAIGIDATAKLIESARQKGIGRFYHLSYEEIIAGSTIPGSPFDAAVFNFCLYQEHGVDSLLKQMKKATAPNGFILIQTLHPYFLKQHGLKQESQWMMDSWKGLPGNFKNGHAWYARTFEDWASVFNKSGLDLHQTITVTNDEETPVSAIFILNGPNLKYL